MGILSQNYGLPAEGKLNVVAAMIKEAIVELNAKYISALDNKDMKTWLSTFSKTPEATYICTSADNTESNLPLSMMYDDSRNRLEDRVTYITNIWAGTFQDYRTRHFTQMLSVMRIGVGKFAAKTSFQVFFTPDETGLSEILAVGVYEDIIEFNRKMNSGLFISRQAITDTSVLPRYLVYPI